MDSRIESCARITLNIETSWCELRSKSCLGISNWGGDASGKKILEANVK